MAGGRYDLQVVFRLFQLWFTLGADRKVNEQLAESFRDIPSHKLLSLVYQIASRMSAAKSGPHYESGFQVADLALALKHGWLMATCMQHVHCCTSHHSSIISCAVRLAVCCEAWL